MPLSVWMGSANWTTRSSKHLEFGAWTTDAALAELALEFVTDVIRAREPRDSSASLPSPQLTEGVWDEDAWQRVVREIIKAHEEGEPCPAANYLPKVTKETP